MRGILSIVVTMLAGVITAGVATAQPSAGPPPALVHYPDAVLVNGKVLTADKDFTIAEAVAIRDGKFLAIGTNAAMRQLVGPATKLIDVRGKTLIPGFINTHLHLADNAERPINWWKDADEVLAGLREQIRSVPEGKWVIRWFNSVASPRIEGKLRRSDLDQIAPRHPLVVGAHTGGYYALNSLALKQLGVAADAEGVEKDPRTGEPMGEVKGLAARRLGIQVAWIDPMEEKIERLRQAIDGVLPLGFTMIHTRINPDGLTALRELWAGKELKLRWRVALTGFRGAEEFFQSFGNLTGIGDEMLRLTGVAPGSADSFGGSGGAWTFAPKLRVPPNSGKSPFGPTDSWERSRETLQHAIKYGWSVVGIHSEGDRATAEVLSDYEKARAGRLVKSRDQIVRLDHLSRVRPEDIPKFKEFGIVPSVAAWHTFVPIDNLVFMYGADAVNNFARSRTFLDAGIVTAAEISSACPFWNIERHVTRRDDAQGRRVWGAHEKVSRQEALRMHTIYAAQYTNEQDRLGSIEVGKLADVAVVDGDFMTTPEDQLNTLTISMVLLGGRVVYENQSPKPCVSERYQNIREITVF